MATGSAALLFAGISLVGGVGTSGAVPVPASGSAFGVSADGLADIAPTPTAPPDETTAGVDVPGVITTGILNAEANLVGDTFTSRASVADLSALTNTVTATAVESTCTTEGGMLTGDSTIADLAITGLLDVPVDPDPDTELTIPGVATVILNEQVTSADGQTLTVNAIRINLLNGTQEIIVAQSVCTLAGDDGTTATTAPSTTAPVTTAPVTTAPVTTAPVTTAPPAPGGPGTAPGATPVPGSPTFTG